MDVGTILAFAFLFFAIGWVLYSWKGTSKKQDNNSDAYAPAIGALAEIVSEKLKDTTTGLKEIVNTLQVIQQSLQTTSREHQDDFKARQEQTKLLTSMREQFDIHAIGAENSRKTIETLVEKSDTLSIFVKEQTKVVKGMDENVGSISEKLDEVIRLINSMSSETSLDKKSIALLESVHSQLEKFLDETKNIKHKSDDSMLQSKESEEGK